MIGVEVKDNESIDRAINRFKKLVTRSRTLNEYKERQLLIFVVITILKAFGFIQGLFLYRFESPKLQLQARPPPLLYSTVQCPNQVPVFLLL